MLMLPLLVWAVVEPSPIEFVAVVQEGGVVAPGPPVTQPKPRTDPATLIATWRYPVEALDARAHGRVTARLAIGARGTVTDCRILTGTGSKLLDERSCMVLRSGDLRFDPARDARDKPVASSYIVTAQWKVPASGTPQPFAAGSSLVRYVLGPNGATLSCTVATSGSVPQPAGGVCAKANLPHEDLAAEWRGGASSGPVTIVRRDEYAIDGEAGAPPLPLPPGYEVFATRTLDMEMSAGGWILECSPATAKDDDAVIWCPTHARYARPGGGADPIWVTMKISLATIGAPPVDARLAFTAPRMVVPMPAPPPYLASPVNVQGYPAPLPMPAPPPPPVAPPAPSIGLPPSPIAPDTWITDADYPAQALRNGDTGVVRFRLIVDTAGKPAECLTTSSSGSNLLDDLACDLMMARASFRPARGAEGEPATGTYSSRITFRIPED